MNGTQLIAKDSTPLLDILGPTVEILTPENVECCVLKGIIPPGVSVPLHSHPDYESMFVLSGFGQVLRQRGDSFEWLAIQPGDFIHIPGCAKHAWRNNSPEALVQLITTTQRLARFFREIGKPVNRDAALQRPTQPEIQRFVETAARHGHWMAGRAENAAVGIDLA
jgi:quercetin dioxygenase-like cupin family protein